MAPSTPADYIGMMNLALAMEDPALVLEHVDLHRSSGPAPARLIAPKKTISDICPLDPNLPVF
jgi:pyruvate/2-oxoglutarate/acetoin dehydrogenase E1 component